MIMKTIYSILTFIKREFDIAAIFSHGMYKHDVLTNYFDEIMESTKFTRWYFGHYHDDRTVMGKFVMLYYSFERVV